MKDAKTKKELSSKQREELLGTLKARFEKNMDRHKGLEWAKVKARLEASGIEVLGVTDHHIFKSIYFFDPNGVRMELTAQLADEFQMLQESKTAHARLDEWTARKAQWRKDRAEGKEPQALKPQTNDRPEFIAPAT